MPKMTAHEALVAIHREMDRQQWTPDTFDRIAEHLKAAGLDCREWQEGDGAEEDPADLRQKLDVVKPYGNG